MIPIVLAHGIARFDVLTDSFRQRFLDRLRGANPIEDQLHYFKGIAPYLRRHGYDVHHARVRFARSVAERALDLRTEIERILAETGQTQVHLIGHSMGGLDARYMIVYEGMAAHIASLTTIGTPHWGTSFADWGLANGGDAAITAVREILDLDGFRDLTPAALRQFNARTHASEATNDVVYHTYASAQDRAAVFAPLQLSWTIIKRREGANDGLVSLRSQQWVAMLRGPGRVKHVHQHAFPVPADHLNQIGWWDLNERRQRLLLSPTLLLEKWHYEQRIKKVYLQLVKDVTATAPALRPVAAGGRPGHTAHV